MADFQNACKLQDLVEGEGKVVSMGKKLLGIFKQGSEVFAIDDVCPHMGASLSSGYVEDGIATCPWHAWRFRLKDGVWADNPRLKVGCYQVRIVEDDVQVMIPDLPEKSK